MAAMAAIRNAMDVASKARVRTLSFEEMAQDWVNAANGLDVASRDRRFAGRWLELRP
jgi:hypothetical protein